MCAVPAGIDADAGEIRALVETVYDRYGFDFRDYAYPSLKRRIANVVRETGVGGVAQLEQRLLYDCDCMERFLLMLSVNTTSMFRDPGFYLSFRRSVVPVLRLMPFVRIWQAGCSTGEEVYSLAIVLKEEGLSSRCRIYATDMNEAVLQKSRLGVYPLAAMQEYTRNYLQAGGLRPFSDYYTAHYGNAVFDPALRESVVFAQHNLATDGSFNEFHVIWIRNVMIYFNRPLQDRVHRLMLASLFPSGFLALGTKESLQCASCRPEYEEIDDCHRIYRRRDQPCTKSS